MIEITNICPLCDRKTIQEYPEKEAMGVFFESEFQPWRDICPSCDMNTGTTESLYHAINTYLDPDNKDIHNWGIRMALAEKYEFGPLQTLPFLEGDEENEFWLNFSGLPEQNCLFFFRPGWLVHTWEAGDFSYCRVSSVDDNGTRRVFPYQLVIEFCPGRLVFTTEQWMEGQYARPTEKITNAFSSMLASLLYTLSRTFQNLGYEDLEPATHVLLSRNKDLIPFYGFNVVHHPERIGG